MRRTCPSKALRESSPGRDNSKGRGRAELVAGGTERRLVGRVNQGEEKWGRDPDLTSCDKEIRPYPKY